MNIQLTRLKSELPSQVTAADAVSGVLCVCG